MLFSCRNKNTDNIDKPEKKSRTDRLVMGLILGGAVGSILAILLAPEKGEKTRAKVIKKTEDFIEAHPKLKNIGIIKKSKYKLKRTLTLIAKKITNITKKI